MMIMLDGEKFETLLNTIFEKFLDEEEKENNTKNEPETFEQFLENNQSKVYEYFEGSMKKEFNDFLFGIVSSETILEIHEKIIIKAERILFYRNVYNVLKDKEYFFENKRYIKILNIILNSIKEKNDKDFEKVFDIYINPLYILWKEYVERYLDNKKYDIIDIDGVKNFIDDIIND